MSGRLWHDHAHLGALGRLGLDREPRRGDVRKAASLREWVPDPPGRPERHLPDPLLSTARSRASRAQLSCSALRFTTRAPTRKTGRSYMSSSLHPPTSRLAEDERRVTLPPLTSAHRTFAVQALWEPHNETATMFPGSKLRLRFAVHPPPAKEQDLAQLLGGDSRSPLRPTKRTFCEGVGRSLRGSRIYQAFGQFTTQAPTFLGHLPACLVTEGGYDFDEFQGPEQGVVVLIVDDDVISRRAAIAAGCEGVSFW